MGKTQYMFFIFVSNLYNLVYSSVCALPEISQSLFEHTCTRKFSHVTKTATLLLSHTTVQRQEQLSYYLSNNISV